ncbi:MAG: hypothetical protein ACTHKA_18655 [Anaerocolumna jejuensis]
MSIDDIKIFLSDKLPEYMIPNNYIKLDKFPISTKGKIDRNVLNTLEYEPEMLNEDESIIINSNLEEDGIEFKSEKSPKRLYK